MNSLLRSAIWVLALSIIAYICGYSYVQSHKGQGFASIFGYRDSAYITAQWSQTIAIFGFFIGIGLLIGGLVKNKHTSQSNFPRKISNHNDARFCSNCGVKLHLDAEFCGNCGNKN